jgi:hypothetical protein
MKLREGSIVGAEVDLRCSIGRRNHESIVVSALVSFFGMIGARFLNESRRMVDRGLDCTLPRGEKARAMYSKTVNLQSGWKGGQVHENYSANRKDTSYAGCFSTRVLDAVNCRSRCKAEVLMLKDCKHAH